MAGIKVDGAKRLEDTLHAAGVEMRQLTAVHGRVAQVIANASEPPRRTGKLAASVSAQSDPERALVAYRAPYALSVEYGTRYMRGRHFLRRAVESTQDKCLQMYTDEIQAICDRVRGA